MTFVQFDNDGKWPQFKWKILHNFINTSILLFWYIASYVQSLKIQPGKEASKLVYVLPSSYWFEIASYFIQLIHPPVSYKAIAYSYKLLYMGKFWRGKKLLNLVNGTPFTNVFLPATSFYNQLWQYTQLIRQIFTIQLVQISPFTNILLCQNFPMYSII